MIRTAHSGFAVAAILAVAPIRFFATVMAAALGHIDFAADDGLDVALAGFVEKIRGSKKIAVIRDGHGRHLLAGRLLKELGRFPNSGQEAVIRMKEQMNQPRPAHRTTIL